MNLAGKSPAGLLQIFQIKAVILIGGKNYIPIVAALNDMLRLTWRPKPTLSRHNGTSLYTLQIMQWKTITTPSENQSSLTPLISIDLLIYPIDFH
jgi:hypothetical protein